MDHYEPIKANRTVNPPDESVEILLATDANGQAFKGNASTQASAAQAAVTAQRIAEMLKGDEQIVWDDKAKEYRPAEARDIATNEVIGAASRNPPPSGWIAPSFLSVRWRARFRISLTAGFRVGRWKCRTCPIAISAGSA